MANDQFKCTNCGGNFPLHEQYDVEDQLLCPDCCEELTFLCDRCGDRFLKEDDHGDDCTSICESCHDNYYYNCTSCNVLLSSGSAYYLESDEDSPYCHDCYQEKLDSSPIHQYNYKPSPIFHGEGSRFFGVELEIDNAGADQYYANAILEAANEKAEHIYIKNDGSLDDGMEIVTHPMTLDYHKAHLPWKEILALCLNFGYLSHKTETCGLHIHVNRTSLGQTISEQEDTISRVLYFVEHHWAELLRFSRRTENQLLKWASRYGYKDRPKEILDTAKLGYSGRYTCVNIQNSQTIEFRIFRGTLKLNTIIATLQLVEEICRVAFLYDDEELNILSWSSFVMSVNPDKYPELITYLKERQLYINEPISAEEDM